jgi:sugar/nucleoside kinase (ribokinase family)
MADLTAALRAALEPVGPGESEPAVLIAADLNYDYIYECPALEGGREVLVRAWSRELAGAGGIVACGLARLGAEVHLLAELGEDTDGRELFEEIARRGVRREGVRRRAGARSAFSLIFADEASGRPRQVATWQGPALEFSLRPAEYLPLLERCALAYSCNYFLLPRLAAGVPELFRQARLRGLATAYDANAGDGWEEPARLELLREGIYPATDLIFLNQDEAAHLTGRLTRGRRRRPSAREQATVVVKRGSKALIRDRAGSSRWRPSPARRCATRWAPGIPSRPPSVLPLRGRPTHCAALASANAASSVLAPGGTAGQLDRGGLAAFLGDCRVLEEGDRVLVRHA